MTEPFSTVCEHCSATLKLKNPDLLGKKVKCPKCGEAFVVSEVPTGKKKPTKKKVADEEAFMDVDPSAYESPPEEEELEDEEDQPVRPKRSSRGGKKKGKKSRGQNDSAQVIKILAIILVVASILGGGGLGLMAFANAVGSSDLDWLPAEVAGYMKIQVDDIWKSGIVQPLVNSEAGKQFVDDMTKNAGVGPQDVDQIVVGFMNGGVPNSEVMVVRFKRPVDFANVLGSREKPETVSHAGGQYQKSGTAAGFLADKNTVVHGSEANIQSLISRGKRNPSASKFGFARGCRDHLVVAILTPGTGGLTAGPGSMMMGLGSNPMNDAENLLIRANSSTNINVSMHSTFKTADVAKGVVDKTQADLAKGRTQLSQQKTQLQSAPANPLVKLEDAKKMMDGLEQVMNSIKVSQSGSRISMQISVTGQLIKDVTEMAQASPFARMPGARHFPSLFRN